MTTSKSEFLSFGRYEGIQKDSGFSAEIVIDEKNFKPHKNIDKHPYSFDGFIEWRITILTDIRDQKVLNTILMERVRGFYHNHDNEECKQNGKQLPLQNHEMICMGYQVFQSKVCDDGLFQADAYRFNLNPEYKTIDSFTCNRGKWDTSILIKRVASQSELIELLTDKFGNEKGIVIIVSDMLHKFEQPKIEIEENPLSLRTLLAYQQHNCQILKPLFNDILNINKEVNVRVIEQLDIGELALDVEVGGECISVHTRKDGWCLCIHNEGAKDPEDIKLGWTHQSALENIDESSENEDSEIEDDEEVNHNEDQMESGTITILDGLIEVFEET